MRRELDIRGERGISVNVINASRAFWARFRTLFGAGVSFGFVLFVALTTASVMHRGSNLAWASWQQLWEEETPKHPKDLTIPEMPSTRKAQPFHPQIMIQRPQTVMNQAPADDYRTTQERRLLLSDLWSRFNQTLSTARSFSR